MRAAGARHFHLPFFFVRELRNFLLILLFGAVILIAVDRIWFDGQYLGVAEQEFGLDISAARRH